jgi:cytidylate kinase
MAGVPIEDEHGIGRVCRNLNLEYIQNNKGFGIKLNGKELGEEIRTPDITRLASDVSAKAIVREYLLEVQRRLAAPKGMIFEGRDMGTVVFPNADIKFFLEAALEVRALRRYNELKDRIPVSYDQVEREMRQRDLNDRTREIAPLKPARDAFLIDSSHLTIPEVLEKMQGFIESQSG